MDPEVVVFRGELAGEMGKILAARIAGAVGAELTSDSQNCRSKQATTATENPDGSTTPATATETTCPTA